MPFLGNSPTEVYKSLSKQTIVGNGGTTYTLDFNVGSAVDLEVFVNNVRQEPDVAYTASGAQIVFVDALLVTDSCYVVYQGKAISSNSIQSQNIADGSVTSAKLQNNIEVIGSLTGTVNGYTPSISNMIGRNKIINGDMSIDQRSQGSSKNLTSGAYIADRCMLHMNGSATGTLQRVVEGPNSEFPYSAKISITTPITNSANLRLQTRQYIENYNMLDLMWGTSSARSVVISFWVKTSVVGKHCIPIINLSETRSYVATYTVDAANTWEFKMLVIPGCTDGTWVDTTNNPITSTTGIRFGFDIGSAKTTYSAPQENTWLNGWYYTVADAAQPGLVAGSTFQFTGIQFEPGLVLTPFDHRQYTTELQLAQRYCVVERYNGECSPLTFTIGTAMVSSAYKWVTVKFPVTMRADPSITTESGAGNGFDNKVRYLTGTGSAAGVDLTPYGIFSSKTHWGFKSYNEANSYTHYGFIAGYMAESEIG